MDNRICSKLKFWLMAVERKLADLHIGYSVFLCKVGISSFLIVISAACSIFFSWFLEMKSAGKDRVKTELNIFSCPMEETPSFQSCILPSRGSNSFPLVLSTQKHLLGNHIPANQHASRKPPSGKPQAKLGEWPRKWRRTLTEEPEGTEHGRGKWRCHVWAFMQHKTENLSKFHLPPHPLTQWAPWGPNYVELPEILDNIHKKTSKEREWTAERAQTQ